MASKAAAPSESLAAVRDAITNAVDLRQAARFEGLAIELAGLQAAMHEDRATLDETDPSGEVEALGDTITNETTVNNET